MNTHRHLKTAEEMSVDRRYVMSCRQRFLTQRLDDLDREIDFYGQWKGDDANAHFASLQIVELLLQKVKAQKELRAIKTGGGDSGITDDMIEEARSYPVERLVEFVRGKAKAWCHEDRNPSLYHGTRTNKAICPVCDKKFGPIDILMSRDGMDFKTAVRSLL